MNKKLLALYGLKWNPFSPELPIEALRVNPRLESFCFRIEQALVREGGFALVTGEPGTGKSVALRVLAERLGAVGELTVGILTHPQSRLGDFYREMGDLFGIELKPHTRWMPFKALRDRWQAHVEATRLRPVLLVDEAQEMSAVVLNELRILVSTRFDSRQILTVVLAGDTRLVEKLRREELVPLGSRIRARLTLEAAPHDELLAYLKHLVTTAGNASLLTPELQRTLVDHAAGNLRVLTTLAAELLASAAEREVTRLDEQLYLDTFKPPAPAQRAAGGRRR